jgi:hypothetical protein
MRLFMATIEQANQEREELENVLTQIVEISPESLVRERVLGEAFNFKAGLPDFERTHRLFRELKEASLDGFSYSTLSRLHAQANDALTSLEAIKNYDPAKEPNAAAKRDELITAIQNKYDSWFGEIMPALAYAFGRSRDVEGVAREARVYLGEIKQTKTEFETSTAKQRAEVDTILTGLRSAAAEGGVSKQASYFKEEAQSHAAGSKWWLFGTIVIGVLTLLFALYSVFLFNQDVKTLTTPEAIQFAVSKLLAFSVLYFALVWTGRNYLAGRHNYTVNRHRQNALNTFQTFVSATADEGTKNAVLVKVSEAVFSPEVTGYLAKEPDARSTAQIIEFARSFDHK